MPRERSRPTSDASNSPIPGYVNPGIAASDRKGTSVNRSMTISALAGIIALPSCSFMSMADRPAQVQDLVGWVERVHVESELAKQKMQAAVTKLDELAHSKFQGTAVEAYKRFATALEESEAQALKLHDAVTPMKKSAGPVFDQWDKDLAEITSPTIRKRSQKRRTQTQQRYHDVVTAIDPAKKTYEVLNRSMRDHALFLGNDLNAASLQLIAEEVTQLTGVMQDLSGRFDTCLRAAQDYVNAYTLPISGTPAAPGAETTERK